MSMFLALLETSGIVDTITSVLGTILYPLFSILFVVIGAVQHVFRVFAGIEPASYDGKPIGSGQSGLEDDTGLVYHLLTRPLVTNMILSIMLLAFFLVLVFTIMAFFKNMYAARPKGWKDIIGSSIKGIANFFFLPICCLLGIWLGNILLDAIDGATSYKGATSMERKLFIACAYNANLYRTGNKTGPEMAREVYAETYGSDAESAVPDGLTDEAYAQIVDQCYVETDVMDIGRTGKVGRHYSLWQINYIVLVSGGIFMLYVLGSIAFAMIKRIFMILVLFIISPAICAMYPLDDGNAVKTWTGKVKGQVLSAYGAVAGMNIFFSIVPLIDKISIFSGGWYGGFGINDIVHLFIYVSGLLVVKDIISMISGMVGGDDAYGTGASLMKSSKDAIRKNTVRTAKVAGVFSKPIAGIAKHSFGVTKGLGTSLKHGANSLGARIDAARENRRMRRRQEAIDSAVMTDEDRANLTEGQKQLFYDSLFNADPKKQARIDKRRERQAERQSERQRRQEEKQARHARGEYTWYEKAGGGLKKGASKIGEIAKTTGGWLGARTSDIKNSEFGKSVGEAGKAALKGTIGLGKIGLEAIGLTGFANDIGKAFTDGMKRYGNAIDPQGADKVSKLLDKMDKEGIKLASESIDKMGSFADPYAKKLIGKDGKSEFAKTMGLEKGDGAAEIKNIDKVLGRLHSYMDRVNNSTGEARDKYLESAIKYATETDADGNAKLQAALNEALNKFIGAKNSGGKVTLDEGTIKEMTQASAQAFADAVKGGFKAVSKELAAEVAKEKAKDKK